MLYGPLSQTGIPTDELANKSFASTVISSRVIKKSPLAFH
jgi:hypothetical protein